MTWYVNFKSPSKAAAKADLVENLIKNMQQRPHTRDFALVLTMLDSAIDTLEECTLPEHVISVTASGHVDYQQEGASGFPRITGLNITQVRVARLRDVPAA